MDRKGVSKEEKTERGEKGDSIVHRALHLGDSAVGALEGTIGCLLIYNNKQAREMDILGLRQNPSQAFGTTYSRWKRFVGSEMATCLG